jgi:hypothetical protein
VAPVTGDQLAIVFYAVVCGVLAAFAPAFGGRAMRAVIGAGVGLAAASILPLVRSGLGF